MAKILITAGGTGGHIFPALAVADVLRDRGVEVIWLGAEHGMEKTLVNGRYPLHCLRVKGVRGNSLINRISSFWAIFKAIFAAVRYCRQQKPDVVLAMGGYASAAGGLAARLCGIPLVLQEQNAIPGMTNKILSFFATKVLQAFPGSFKESKNPMTVGNPVRAELKACSDPAIRFKAHTGPLRILVCGGSQGARFLNQLLPKVCKQVVLQKELVIKHQCGAADVVAVQNAYTECGINAEVFAFIEDMAEAYSWADVLVARAGASTVSECMAVGMAVIFIPFLQAVDDHQMMNARQMVDMDAAKVVKQNDQAPENLIELLSGMTRETAAVWASHAHSLGVWDSANKIADECLQLFPPPGEPAFETT